MSLNFNYEIVEKINPDDDFVYFFEEVKNEDASIIGLCTLGAVNFGNVKSPDDLEKPMKLLVRALNEILDYQEYPIPAAKNSVDMFRNLGIGIINLAYFLAKHNFKYSSEGVLEFLQPFVEAYSYYAIRESMLLAKAHGPCEAIDTTKYKQGILPGLNYKKSLDEYVEDVKLLDWKQLSEDCKTYGVRNASLLSIMPAETSASLSNATNGIEPPRSLVSVKGSKDGALKQVVPEIGRLKKKYDLMWDQKRPHGYLKICGLIEKYIDQAISVNTNYNPEYYENNEIPMSELLQDLLLAYKLGLPTLYYLNTADGSGEIDISKLINVAKEKMIPEEWGHEIEEDEEACEACVI